LLKLLVTYAVRAYNNLCTGEAGERQTVGERQQGLDRDGAGRRARRHSRGRFLVMGKKSSSDESQLFVTYVRSLDRQRSRQLRRAMRAMRRQTATICARDGINAAFAAVSPPYRATAADKSRNKSKKEGEEKLSSSRSSNNDMKRTRGRRERKHKRRSSAPAETETETKT